MLLLGFPLLVLLLLPLLLFLLLGSLFIGIFLGVNLPIEKKKKKKGAFSERESMYKKYEYVMVIRATESLLSKECLWLYGPFPVATTVISGALPLSTHCSIYTIISIPQCLPQLTFFLLSLPGIEPESPRHLVFCTLAAKPLDYRVMTE